jgi:hypothetical protein
MQLHLIDYSFCLHPNEQAKGACIVYRIVVAREERSKALKQARKALTTKLLRVPIHVLTGHSDTQIFLLNEKAAYQGCVHPLATKPN